MNWKKPLIKENNDINIPKNWLNIEYYEAINILFRIENSLRIFVYAILKNEFKHKWVEISIMSDDSVEGTINSIAKKRISQINNFGYLNYPVTCPIMHLTSGELIRIITSEAYWKHFSKYFKAKKDIIKIKLDEIGVIRNSLAHFRPIKSDDIEVIKQNAQHVLLAIEYYLLELIKINDIVPTNCKDEWYCELKNIGNEYCVLSFHQSKNVEWVKIAITYTAPIIKSFYFKEFYGYTVLNIVTSKIINECPVLANNLTFLSETIPYTKFNTEDSTVEFKKVINLNFSKNILEQNHTDIKKEIETLLYIIMEETDLIKQDNLARGKVIETVSANASFKKNGDSGSWSVYTYPFTCHVKPEDSVEYWGSYDISTDDIIASIHKYPWMPVEVSKQVFPW